MLYASQEERGLQWPVQNDGAGTTVLYENGYPTGRAELITPAFVTNEDSRDAEFPLWFVPGRVLLQQEREIKIVEGRQNTIQRDELFELNPFDAEELSIEDGSRVMVDTRDRSVAGLARINEGIPVGVISSTTLFGQIAVDLQASEETEAASRVPGLVICPARVIKGD